MAAPFDDTGSGGPAPGSRVEAVIAGLREKEALLRKVLAEQLELIAEAEQLGAHTLAGARSVKVWLSRLLNIDEAEAKTRTLVAGATTARASSSGEQSRARNYLPPPK